MTFNYRPLIRIIGDRFPWQVKSAILSTLSIIIRKGGLALKPFLPQLQTTFIKCLQDNTRCALKHRIYFSFYLLRMLACIVDSVFLYFEFCCCWKITIILMRCLTFHFQFSYKPRGLHVYEMFCACRTVRTSAALALGKLSALSTRVDPLVSDLLSSLQVALVILLISH